MEVILLEKITKLGNIGDVVKVKQGFARNYLLPRKIAIRATEANKKIFEEKKAELEKNNLEKIKTAKELLKLIPKSVELFREASDQGALFGSVTSRDIIKILNNDPKVDLSAKDVVLKSIIKDVGTFSANINLHPEVTSTIEINVRKNKESESSK